MREQRLKLEKIEQDLAMKKDITELFCWVDDFCVFINKERRKIEDKSKKHMRVPALNAYVSTISLQEF